MRAVIPEGQEGSFNWGQFWAAQAIGWPVMLALLLVLTGAWSTVASLLFYSIACSLGLGLVFWVLVAWPIGYVLLAAYNGIKRRP
jgi:hypothetical protein